MKTTTQRKQPVRCKLVIYYSIVVHVKASSILGCTTLKSWTFIKSSDNKIFKSRRTIGCLNQTVWKNYYSDGETQMKIYKWHMSNTVRPVLLYAMWLLPAATKTERKMQKTEKRNVPKWNYHTWKVYKHSTCPHIAEEGFTPEEDNRTTALHAWLTLGQLQL